VAGRLISGQWWRWFAAYLMSFRRGAVGRAAACPTMTQWPWIAARARQSQTLPPRSNTSASSSCAWMRHPHVRQEAQAWAARR